MQMRNRVRACMRVCVRVSQQSDKHSPTASSTHNFSTNNFDSLLIQHFEYSRKHIIQLHWLRKKPTDVAIRIYIYIYLKYVRNRTRIIRRILNRDQEKCAIKQTNEDLYVFFLKKKFSKNFKIARTKNRYGRCLPPDIFLSPCHP